MSSSVEEAFSAQYPFTPLCAGVLDFLSGPATYLAVDPRLEEPAASAMAHVYDCLGCRYRLSGLRGHN